MLNNLEIPTKWNSVLTQQKSFGWDYNPHPPSAPVRTRKQKAYIRTLKIPSACQSLVDFGNTQITLHALKNVKVFKMLKLETIGKKKDVVIKHD